MNFQIHTLFKDIFNSFLSTSLISKAIENNILQFNMVDIRDYTKDKHRKVDDSPYGGGAGMLMSVEPLYESLIQNPLTNSKVIYMTPSGKLLKQKDVKSMALNYDNFTIVCGHYEGFDNRIFDLVPGEQISLGDFICMSGETTAMCLIEALARYKEGVISNSESLEKESYNEESLEYPQYTKPQNYKNYEVPEILLSGHHAKIEKYRKNESIFKTFCLRPDLFIKLHMDNIEIDYLLDKVEGTS